MAPFFSLSETGFFQNALLPFRGVIKKKTRIAAATNICNTPNVAVRATFLTFQIGLHFGLVPPDDDSYLRVDSVCSPISTLAAAAFAALAMMLKFTC